MTCDNHASRVCIATLLSGAGGEFSLPEPIMTTWTLIVPLNVDIQELMNGSGHTGATLGRIGLLPV
jgi:hypothetical protein